MRIMGVSRWAYGLLVCLSLSVAANSHANTMTDLGNEFWEGWNEFVSDITDSSLDGNYDPWEPFNRSIFTFNDTADHYVLTPLSKGYQWITPAPVEKGIGNMFANLLEITTIANDLLQFKFTQAASDSGRFLVNSSVGLLGFFDVATPIGLEKHNEDFGQTLGRWGVGSGPYLVVPFFGSYTLRSGAGTIADTTTGYFGRIDHVPTRNQLWAVETLDRRAGLFTAEELITGDRYTFIRDAYLLQREYLLNDGVVEDNFGDEDYEGDWDEEWAEEDSEE